MNTLVLENINDIAPYHVIQMMVNNLSETGFLSVGSIPTNITNVFSSRPPKEKWIIKRILGRLYHGKTILIYNKP